MHVLTLKVTVGGDEGKEKKKEKELEEFLHRYRDFLNPEFVYDPILIRRFKLEKDRLMKELDLGFRERMLIRRMEMNVRIAEERRMYQILGHDDFYGMWFL